MELRGATVSHVGNVRDVNQDRSHFGGFVAAVADGMGGHQGGETAAQLAIDCFESIPGPLKDNALVEVVEIANQSVFSQSTKPNLRGMGTTLVAMTLLPSEEKVIITNVGDSRAYQLRNDQMGQLTFDHSLVEDLVRQNRLTPEEALVHPQRNILTRALGIGPEVEVDRFHIPIKLGDRFLLCSDGLFNEVTDDEIKRILMEFESPDQAGEALVNAALASVGRDNITVAVVDIVEEGQGGNLTSAELTTTADHMIMVNTADLLDPKPESESDSGPEPATDPPPTPPAANRKPAEGPAPVGEETDPGLTLDFGDADNGTADATPSGEPSPQSDAASGATQSVAEATKKDLFRPDITDVITPETTRRAAEQLLEDEAQSAQSPSDGMASVDADAPSEPIPAPVEASPTPASPAATPQSIGGQDASSPSSPLRPTRLQGAIMAVLILITIAALVTYLVNRSDDPSAALSGRLVSLGEPGS